MHDGSDEAGDMGGALRAIHRADEGAAVFLVAILHGDGCAVVVSEEEGLAATDFPPVQQPYPPGTITCKSAGDGAVLYGAF